MCLCAAKICRGIDVEEPIGRWQAVRVGCVPGLDHRLDSENCHRLTQAGSGGLNP